MPPAPTGAATRPPPSFDAQALMCTDPAPDPLRIVGWVVQRWRVEVIFRDMRDHLGIETQRQWLDKAVARTTPCLLALFSAATLLAAHLSRRARLRVSASASRPGRGTLETRLRQGTSAYR
jgi:hypothetical protein